MYGPRYYFAALPALLLLTAHGMQLGWRTLGRSAWVLHLLALALVLGNLFVVMPALVQGYRDYNFVTARYQAEIESVVVGKGIVFVDELPQNWWEYGSFFSGNTPWLDSRIIYARDLGAAVNDHLLLHFPDYQPYYWRDGKLRP